jgi:hypothetical protein
MTPVVGYADLLACNAGSVARFMKCFAAAMRR